MKSDGGDLSPGSRLPRDGTEADLLLRRVPEVALLAEFATARFTAEQLSRVAVSGPRAGIAELADVAYLGRLRTALAALIRRADEEKNGGLRFISSSLLHFVTSLPPERHPLVVALYFRSLAGEDSSALRPEELAFQMDEYESSLPP